MNDLDYSELNPGIRETVRWLREQGFNTVSSGDGVTHECECDAEWAYMTMLVEPVENLVSETIRLLRLLQERGVELCAMEEQGPVGPTLEAVYLPATGHAVIELMLVDDALLQGGKGG